MPQMTIHHPIRDRGVDVVDRMIGLSRTVMVPGNPIVFRSTVFTWHFRAARIRS